MLVNFFLVGATKAGTTWIYESLKCHPDVLLSDVKEVHFFSTEFHRGVDWYHDFFTGHNNEKIVGDICGSYLSNNRVSAQRIFKYNHRAKILFNLRNPIDRAYSNYCMNLRSDNNITRNIEEYIRPGTGIVDYGLYFYHMKDFLEYFLSNQLKIMFFEDLENDPYKFLMEIYDFLEISRDHTPIFLDKKTNIRKPLLKFKKVNNIILVFLNQLLKYKPVQRSLASVQTSVLSRIYHSLRPSEDYPVLTGEMKKLIAEYYREDVSKLSKLVNRDLSYWLEVDL